MATQQQRSEGTRQKLLDAFRTAFLEQGFDGATTQHILSETGLSKGALYHHFHSKTEIMEEIYRAESQGAIARAVSRVNADAAPLDRLLAACIAWTEEIQAPGTSRILFEIGPSALGQRRAREIEDGYSLAQFERALAEAADAGDIHLSDPEFTASMLNAIVAEATLHGLRTGKDMTAPLAETLKAVLAPLRRA